MRPSFVVMVSFSTVPGPSVVRRRRAVGCRRPRLQMHRVRLTSSGGDGYVCIVMRLEGKGTGQIDRAPAAADVPVATEKKLNSPRCQARFSSCRCEWGRRQVRRAIAVASCRCCSTALMLLPGNTLLNGYSDAQLPVDSPMDY